MKYGIRDGMLREPLERIFPVAKELGFDGVEYCIGKDYKDSLLWQADGARKLKSLADEAGMDVSSLSPGVFASVNPALPEPEKRAEGRAILSHVIETCPKVGTRDILVPMFPRDVPEWPDETWDRLVEGFKPLAALAEKHGVRLNLETSFNADQLQSVIDRIGSDAVKVYYDTANQTNRGFDVPKELRQLGAQVGMIHAKDTDQAMLGEGKVDFDAVDAAMRDIRYDGYIVLETPAGDDPKAAHARNLAFVRKLGG
ncbi:MAG: sugar phosphate isomerase/epimerase [Kiritimatiellae bacterium]|nr:sugar phosphate isomerase/epimerase [Kiritimatiellia bacterium]